MIDIDWGKAGEGCIGAFTRGEYVFYVKTKCESDWAGRPGFTGLDVDGDEYRVFTKFWTWHERPASWNGEGLPPVGTVCLLAEPTEYFKPFHPEWAGREVKIYAHFRSEAGIDLAAYVGTDNQIGGVGYAKAFQRLRTAEQIAADERDKAIEEIASLLNGLWSSEREAAEFIYRAGYRKVEVKP